MKPLVTIVTPCFNSARFIDATIKSVLSQTYSPIEYIIIDGGSTDDTSTIAQKYSDQLIFISEPDSGQSNAINKGWKLANGQIVAWLNADDRYYPNTVATAVEFFESHKDVSWVYGNADFVDADDIPFFFKVAVPEWDQAKLLNDVNYILQPSVFLRREVLDRCGLLNEDLHYVMDYEYWLRIGQTFPGCYAPDLQVQISYYADTKTSSGGTRRVRELEALVSSYGVSELPQRHQSDWALAFMQEAVREIKSRQWRAAAASAMLATRYPFGLTSALLKLGRRLVPEKMRQMVRKYYATLRSEKRSSL